ncbi:hypothetical protein ACWCW7_34550 [Nocardia tengchongensis]
MTAEVTIRVLCAATDREVVVDFLDVHVWQLQSLAAWLTGRGGEVQLLVDGVPAPVPESASAPTRYEGPTLTAERARDLINRRAVYVGFDGQRRETVTVLRVLHDGGVHVRFLTENYTATIPPGQLATEADIALSMTVRPPSYRRAG